jgi:hypothetical protein
MELEGFASEVRRRVGLTRSQNQSRWAGNKYLVLVNASVLGAVAT